MINIVLYEPEIPENTGNIMRTCVAIGARLHLIEPLGFKLDEKKMKRSVLDYFKNLEYFVYQNFDEFVKNNQGNYYYITRYGHKTYSDIEFRGNNNIYLIFGKESTGIDRTILANNIDKCYRIPTTDKVRSINLSNAVALVSYEALRQNDFQNLYKEEPDTWKGKDYLDNYLKK